MTQHSSLRERVEAAIRPNLFKPDFDLNRRISGAKNALRIAFVRTLYDAVAEGTPRTLVAAPINGDELIEVSIWPDARFRALVIHRNELGTKRSTDYRDYTLMDDSIAAMISGGDESGSAPEPGTMEGVEYYHIFDPVAYPDSASGWVKGDQEAKDRAMRGVMRRIGGYVSQIMAPNTPLPSGLLAGFEVRGKLYFFAIDPRTCEPQIKVQSGDDSRMYLDAHTLPPIYEAEYDLAYQFMVQMEKALAST